MTNTRGREAASRQVWGWSVAIAESFHLIHKHMAETERLGLSWAF